MLPTLQPTYILSCDQPPQSLSNTGVAPEQWLHSYNKSCWHLLQSDGQLLDEEPGMGASFSCSVVRMRELAFLISAQVEGAAFLLSGLDVGAAFLHSGQDEGIGYPAQWSRWSWPS